METALLEISPKAYAVCERIKPLWQTLLDMTAVEDQTAFLTVVDEIVTAMLDFTGVTHDRAVTAGIEIGRAHCETEAGSNVVADMVNQAYHRGLTDGILLASCSPNRQAAFQDPNVVH